MKWHYIKDNDIPKSKSDHVLCLCDTKHGYDLLSFNTYYQCWDDKYVDDVVYDLDCDQVSRWISIDDIAKYIKEYFI